MIILLLDLSADKLVIECEFQYGEQLVLIDPIKRQPADELRRAPGVFCSI